MNTANRHIAEKYLDAYGKRSHENCHEIENDDKNENDGIMLISKLYSPHFFLWRGKKISDFCQIFL